MSHLPEVVTADPALSITGRMYGHIPYEAGPQWGATIMARTFFDRSKYWVRWLESSVDKEDHLTLDGVQVGRRKTDSGARVYGLRDVEEIAYALAERGLVDGSRLRTILLALFYIGEIHGLQTQGLNVRPEGRGWKLNETPDKTSEEKS